MVKGLSPKQIIEKAGRLKSERMVYEAIWQQIGTYIRPLRKNFQGSELPGTQKYVDVLDGTAMTSLELLAGFIHGLLTNPAGYFFGLTTGIPALDEQDSVRLWIQEVVRTLHYYINNSNFQTEVQEFYQDLIAFGTGVMSIEDDPDTLFRFGTRDLKEIYIAENSKGFVDMLYRCYSLDLRGLVDDFGLEKLPEKLKKEYADGKDTKYEIIHAIYPVPKEQRGGVFKYICQYVLVNEKFDLEIEGFKEFPYLVPRWSKASGENYGRGLGEKALPEAKVLNKMTETTLRGAQKVVDPPIQLPDDGFILPLVTKPGGVNYYRAGSDDRAQTIFSDSRIDFGFQSIDRKQAQIREAFYVDQLKLREGPQMTAQEVNTRVEQGMRFLSPMLGRQTYEFLQPMIERIYSIATRKGKIPQAPPELRGKELKVQYSSILAITQRYSEIQSIRSTMTDVAPFAAADPSVLHNFDGDRAAHVIARINNFPQEILRNKKDLALVRKQLADQQAQALQQEQLKTQADASSKAITAASKFKDSQSA